MEYAEIKCRNCGSPMKVIGSATHIKCEWCGSEYILSDRGKRQAEVQTINYAGRGPLFQTYVPRNWNFDIFDDTESISSLAPVCKGIQLRSPDLAQLVFYPFAYYKDAAPKPSLFSFGIPNQSSGDYQLDPMSLVCNCRWMELPQYAYRRIYSISNQLIHKPISELEICSLSIDQIQQKALHFQQMSTEKLKNPCFVMPGKFRFSFSSHGQLYKGYFATILSHVQSNDPANQNVSGQASWASGGFQTLLKKGMSTLGSMYGIGGLEAFDWGRSFDLMILYPAVPSDTTSYESVFDRFLKELKYGSVYFSLQDEELRNAQQVQIQGAMMRQQNAIRASQNLSRTLSETSDIVNQACQQHSQQMDRIYDRSTQGIRGVDTYWDSSGRSYEADVKYDHIYKNGNTFVASSDGSLHLGPDWEELKR